MDATGKHSLQLTPRDIPDASTRGGENVRIVSWNLLHSIGAVAEDIAALINKERPDLLIMQEATEAVDQVSRMVGGRCYHQPWPSRKHGLAVWTATNLSRTHSLRLPTSNLPGSLPSRVAQLIEVSGMTIANVHLSHGQVLNRLQLRNIARSTTGPTAIIGDYNAVGPIALKGFHDVGPREATHQAQELLPFRLDRCMVRELLCKDTKSLSRGASDHKPISITLSTRKRAG